MEHLEKMDPLDQMGQKECPGNGVQLGWQVFLENKALRDKMEQKEEEAIQE